MQIALLYFTISHNFGTTLRQLWENVGTTLGKLGRDPPVLRTTELVSGMCNESTDKKSRVSNGPL